MVVELAVLVAAREAVEVEVPAVWQVCQRHPMQVWGAVGAVDGAARQMEGEIAQRLPDLVTHGSLHQSRLPRRGTSLQAP